MLSITNLRLLRGNSVILDGFTNALNAGQGAWLLGANGSGKTSLLRAVAGLLPPLAGTITANNKLFIGTHAGHDAALTCAENLKFWYATHISPSPQPSPQGEGVAPYFMDKFGILSGTEAAPSPWGEGWGEGVLKQAGLESVMHKPAAELSAGQSQRLALARLLCTTATLWLLDEPFSALDAAGQQWLCGIMQNHLANGGAIVCATHQTYDVPGMMRWPL